MSNDCWEDQLIAEQHYRQLLDHCPDMILVHEGGRFVYMNPAGVRWLGGTSEEQFIGRRVTEIVHPGEIHAVLARIASLRCVGDSSGPTPETLRRLDGTTMDVEVVSVLTRWNGKLAYLVIMHDLSAQKAAEKTLRYQAALVNYVSDAIIATTVTGIVTSWNPAAETIYHCPAAKALGRPVSEAVGAPLDPAAIVSNGGVARVAHRTSGGTVLSVRVSAAAMDDGFVLVCTDQTALLQAEQHFQTVVDSLGEGVVVLDSEGRVESVNPAALRILGVDSSDRVYDSARRVAIIPIIQPDGRIVNPDQRALFEFLKTQASQTRCVLGVDCAGDGQRVWLSANGQLLDPDNPQSSSVLLSFIDITAQHAASQRLAYEAAHDGLTGLPNRGHVLSHMSRHLDERDPAGRGAVLFIDLDKFKAVNDSLGHEAGDILLKTAAHRLKAAFRAGDVVGRLGGDEFIALVQGEISQTGLNQLVERIHAALAKPVSVRGAEVAVTASIGIAVIAKDDPRNSRQIVRDAEAAMYHAKSSGGKMSRYFMHQLPQPNH
ncbi:regulatory protein [Mycobacterium haemophilum DSM 44634]|uniref:sensor domain-containing protein n=1 Tax=Mycobacterium haemophilum TaxID=29311 RepID=UPI0006565350|nr:diguanylate cyclase [Mycobacterium haemophilum]AKN17747.1 diguanylate cyclase [Mycobacterium haemophilum DSM 44634]MCV7340848.1 diguanylate cyclase [Mycobacterium haemophilum DSM 44634]